MRPIPPPYLRAECRKVLIREARRYAAMAIGLALMSVLTGGAHHPRLSGLDAVVAAIYALIAFDHFDWARQIKRAGWRS